MWFFSRFFSTPTSGLKHSRAHALAAWKLGDWQLLDESFSGIFPQLKRHNPLTLILGFNGLSQFPEGGNSEQASQLQNLCGIGRGLCSTCITNFSPCLILSTHLGEVGLKEHSLINLLMQIFLSPWVYSWELICGKSLERMTGKPRHYAIFQEKKIWF